MELAIIDKAISVRKLVCIKDILLNLRFNCFLYNIKWEELMSDDTKNQQELKTQPIPEKKYKISFLGIIISLLCFLYIATVIISVNIFSKKSTTFTKTTSVNIIKKARGKIAVIPVYGPIYKRESLFSEKGSDFLVSMIKKYGEDEDIKGIVLDINSPGGSVGAVQEIYSIITKIKQQYKKPFVAHFGDVAASGAYYVASACDKIISNSGSITGSIGVIFSIIEGEDLLKKIGVKANVVKSGKFKDIGSFSREMTKEEKKILEDMINDTYNIFVDVVAKGRKMSVEKVKDISDGRVFTGNQAVSLGLVDKIGDLYDAIDEAGILAGLGKNPQVVRVRGQLIDEFLSGFSSKFNFINLIKDDKIGPLLEYRFIF